MLAAMQRAEHGWSSMWDHCVNLVLMLGVDMWQGSDCPS